MLHGIGIFKNDVYQFTCLTHSELSEKLLTMYDGVIPMDVISLKSIVNDNGYIHTDKTLVSFGARFLQLGIYAIKEIETTIKRKLKIN